MSQLPHTPEATIVHLMQKLGVPKRLYELLLRCQAFTIPGWSGWVKYQSEADAKRLTGPATSRGCWRFDWPMMPRWLNRLPLASTGILSPVTIKTLQDACRMLLMTMPNCVSRCCGPAKSAIVAGCCKRLPEKMDDPL